MLKAFAEHVTRLLLEQPYTTVEDAERPPAASRAVYKIGKSLTLCAGTELQLQTLKPWLCCARLSPVCTTRSQQRRLKTETLRELVVELRRGLRDAQSSQLGPTAASGGHMR